MSMEKYKLLLERGTKLANNLRICLCQNCIKMHYFRTKTPDTTSWRLAPSARRPQRLWRLDYPAHNQKSWIRPWLSDNRYPTIRGRWYWPEVKVRLVSLCNIGPSRRHNGLTLSAGTHGGRPGRRSDVTGESAKTTTNWLGQLNFGHSTCCIDARVMIFGGRRSKQATATQESFGRHHRAHFEKCSDETSAHTADDFAAFFQDKVETVRASTSATPLYDVPFKATESTLDDWTAVTTDEVNRLISASPNKTCQLDPVPTWLVKEMRELLAPFIARWLGGLLVERRTSVSQIRGSIPGQVAAV